MGSLGNKDVMAKNIQRYMNINNVERNDICKAIGVPYTTFSDWINAKTYPRIDKIEMMANYFKIKKSDLVEPPLPPGAIPVPKMRRIPVLGSIRAGLPILAEENIESYEYADIPEGQELFFLRVKGDSMSNARICDGDLVLIRQQPCANDGQVVACLVNGDEATLKRFYRQKDMIILKPENAAYSPIIVPCSDFDSGHARILGVVVKVEFRL